MEKQQKDYMSESTWKGEIWTKALNSITGKEQLNVKDLWVKYEVEGGVRNGKGKGNVGDRWMRSRELVTHSLHSFIDCTSVYLVYTLRKVAWKMK